MTADELRKHFPHISEDCIRKTLGLGSVAMPQREQSTPKTLDGQPHRHRKRPHRTCAVISLISFRRRELDGDNLVAGFKPLRDALADTLGINDADPRIRWQYGQCETRGETGTIVKIERL